MKIVKYVLIGVAVLAIIIFSTLIILKMNKKSKPVEGITSLHLSYSTGYHMYAYTIYDIELRDGKYIASIKPTDIPDEDKKEFEIDEKTVKEIEKKLTEYKVFGWDGFHESDHNVLDGDSFSFSLNLSNGESVSASGYMRWPENYRDVRNYLDEVLGSLYK